MKKSVLLGIAAVSLFALSAYAGEAKFPIVPVPDPTKPSVPWPGSWSWSYDYQTVCTIPVKMKIPFYVHIKNQDPIWLVQVDCSTIGKNPAKDKDWPCFKGCNDSEVACNFNIKLAVDFSPTSAVGASGWDKSVSPSTINAPGGNTTFCVWAWNVDLLGQAAGSEVQVGTLTVKVKPN